MTTGKKINKLKNGFFPGLVLPLVVFIVMYFGSENELPFGDYLYGIWKLNVLIKLLALCVLPNLALFLYFYHKKYDLAARGVLMATFVYAFVSVISKAF